ncbi:MAG: cobalamin biosynthesis protein [Dehalococcoidia bacterium]|nr:cobalamin biosynthesis protein [Dehalococcoidia bacterium]
MEIVIILLIALALDLILGEPSNTWHPIAWMGKLISLETKLSPKKDRARQLTYGIGMVLITLGLTVTAIYLLLSLLSEFNLIVYVIITGFLLKFTFSLRGLRQAIDTVKKLIAKNDLGQARLSLQSLVSRDTTKLDKKQVISATVESAAENICDSFVAPLFYFFLFGVPGAIGYRVINTFDSMVGYHGQWEYLGKFAAKLDDIANFIPARIASLIIVVASLVCRKNASQAWHIMIRDHKKTESPNAGWTMSAIAGALGIQLEKIDNYRLGDNHYPLSLDTINDSRQIIFVTAIIWCLISIFAEVIYFVVT